MMELGATVCTPQTPRCGECPITSWCSAHALGIAGELPAIRRKPATLQMTIAAAVLLDASGRTLVLRHTEKDGVLFSRLWQFPAVIAHAQQHSKKGGTQKLCNSAQAELSNYLEEALRIKDVALVALRTAKHAVTFRNIRLAPFLGRVDKLPAVAGARTPKLSELAALPISSATRKIAAAVSLVI